MPIAMQRRAGAPIWLVAILNMPQTLLMLASRPDRRLPECWRNAVGALSTLASQT